MQVGAGIFSTDFWFLIVSTKSRVITGVEGRAGPLDPVALALPAGGPAAGPGQPPLQGAVPAVRPRLLHTGAPVPRGRRGAVEHVGGGGGCGLPPCPALTPPGEHQHGVLDVSSLHAITACNLVLSSITER